MPEHKTCTECGTAKPLASFYRNAESRDGRHTKCKACIQAAQAEYRADNEAKIKARRRANRDVELAALRRWYERNPDRDAHYYQAHKAERAASARRWMDRNPGYSRDRAIRRRARLAGPVDMSTVREYVGIISQDPCVYCGSASAEIDHIRPVAAGGSGAWDNLAPTCAACNRSKHTRDVLQMLLRRLTA